MAPIRSDPAGANSKRAQASPKAGADFRFLDRLVRLVPGKQGVGEYTVRGDEPWLQGHFPGEPILPGVLLVEAATQLAVAVAQSEPGTSPRHRLRLASLPAVKIFGAALPGETVRLEASVKARSGALVQAEAAAFVSGVRVLSAQIALARSAGPPKSGR